MKNFDGKVLFLDRSDINTDEIIPARYLTELTKEGLKPFLLEDLTLADFDPTTDLIGKSAVLSRNNFGCGSSREHAPWAFEVNDINIVIASGYARIFRQNMFNNGMMAITLSEETIETLFKTFKGKETSLKTDFEKSKLVFSTQDKTIELDFNEGEFDRELVKAGGWVNFADSKY